MDSQKPKSKSPDQNSTVAHPALAPLSRAVGRLRYVVLLAVVAVLLVALSLFMLGTIEAARGVWDAWQAELHGGAESAQLGVEFLSLVSLLLKAVIFYLIGVGFYSLFIAPLNLTVSLGIETLEDLEAKIVSALVVIMAVRFLEKFIQWKDPLETLQFGGAMAFVIATLVLFQWVGHRVKEDKKRHHPDTQARAQRQMVQHHDESHDMRADEE